MKTYVLFHRGCWDGFCAAWIAKNRLKGDVEFIPVQYGEEQPVIPLNVRLYILDFSYTREQLLKWWMPPNAVTDLVLLDHHKTAQEALTDFDKVCETLGVYPPKIVFDMSKSGARLTWEHFNPGAPSPGIVDYTEDRDLWRWKLKNSRAVNAAIRSYELDFDIWDGLFEDVTPDQMSELFSAEGEAILRRETQIIESHIGYARDVNIAGYKVPCVNATVLTSEIAGALAQGKPFACCYFDRADGSRIYSLRSTDEGVDVSDIAKRFGGGGHRNAAGFEIARPRDKLQFELLAEIRS